ncbi:MAG: glucosaminidase domain-containing protein [Paenibacillaceae bacterium]
MRNPRYLSMIIYLLGAILFLPLGMSFAAENENTLFTEPPPQLSIVPDMKVDKAEFPQLPSVQRNIVHKMEEKTPQKPTSTVRSDSGLTESQIGAIFKGTSLADYGLEKVILEVEAEYGINAYFTIAVMKLESAHGESKIAVNKNNLFGLNALDGDGYNKAFSFKTKADSVQKFGQLISKNYVGKGYTTIEKVSKKYCLANPQWSDLVMSIMLGDYSKL